MMRKITAFSTCMTLIFALTSCGNNTASDGHSETFSGTDADQIAISAENETEKTITADSESVGGQYGCEAMPEGTPCKVTLKMDFTNGRDTADILEKEYIFCYRDPDGEDVEVVPQDIIRGLLEETGFSFSAAIEQKDDGIHIDFNADSSLFASNQAAGHDEKYTFFETQSKACFHYGVRFCRLSH